MQTYYDRIKFNIIGDALWMGVAMRQQWASVLVRSKEVVLETRPIPNPDEDEVLVRVRAVGICGSDLHYFKEGRIGDFVVESPIVLGHEVSGEIVAVGAGVPASRIGERVSLEPQRTDPWSEQSRLGRYNLDPSIEFFATPPYDGALCEYVTIPSGSAFKVPDVMSFEEAALLEPLAVAVAAIRHANLRFGDRVAVAGAGPIGLLVAQLSAFGGASEVVVSDPLAHARARALRYGATRAIDSLVEPFPEQEFDLFIDASGVPAAIRGGIHSLRPRGCALLLGMGPDTIEIPFSVVQVRELRLQGVFRYANAWPAAIDFASRIDLAGLITGRYGLRQVPEALEAAASADQVKVVVLPEADSDSEGEIEKGAQG